MQTNQPPPLTRQRIDAFHASALRWLGRLMRLILALGTPGSLRIFPALAQVIGNVLFQGMDLQRAVAAGRIHWENNRFFFEGDIDPEIRARARQELDQPVDERRSQDLFFGGVHALEVLGDGTITGVADPRREGVAVPL